MNELRPTDAVAPHAASPPAPVARGSDGFRTTLERRTPMSGADAALHLSEAWCARFGAPPEPRTLAVLWAQWALETGRGQSMLGYNFAGLKGTGPTGKSTVTWTHEGHGANEHRERARFRAYDTAADGARDYLDLLATRFPGALRAAGEGSPDRFVGELRRGGYFTADPTKYRDAVKGLTHEYTRQGPSAGIPAAPVDPGPAVEALLWTLGRAIARHTG